VRGRRLVVVGKGEAFWVVWEDDPDDWLVIFSKREGFPAREWAERMVDLYNRGSGVEDQSQDPLMPFNHKPV